MEIMNSLTCSQLFATGLCPEPGDYIQQEKGLCLTEDLSFTYINIFKVRCHKAIPRFSRFVLRGFANLR